MNGEKIDMAEGMRKGIYILPTCLPRVAFSPVFTES